MSPPAGGTPKKTLNETLETPSATLCINSPEDVGEEDDEPLGRVGEHRRRRHEEEEDDEEDVRHRQEYQQTVEVRVLAPSSVFTQIVCGGEEVNS